MLNKLKAKLHVGSSETDETPTATGGSGTSSTTPYRGASGGASQADNTAAGGGAPTYGQQQSTTTGASSHSPGTGYNTSGPTSGSQGTGAGYSQQSSGQGGGLKEKAERAVGVGGGSSNASDTSGTGGRSVGGSQSYASQGQGGQGYSSQSQGQGQGYSSQSQGQGQGYAKTGGATPEYASGTQSYQVGKESDLTSRREAMGNVVGSTSALPTPVDENITQSFTSEYDHAAWQEAMRKTELAEKEVATATMAANKANAALQHAQRAQGVVDGASAKHAELLDEAERQRALVSSPQALQDEYNRAISDLEARKEAAAQHNRRLRELEAAARAKQAEVDRTLPIVEKQQRQIQGLANEYDAAMGKRETVLADADRLRGLADDDERRRGGLGATVESLLEKLRLAEGDLKERERAFLQARENHHRLGLQLQEARSEYDGLAGQHRQHAAAADTAYDSAQGWERRTQELRAQLQEHEGENNRLLQLINKLKQELEAALAELEGLRGRGQPNQQAILDAESQVGNRRESLREAEARARDAEARYRRLLADADAHKAKGAEAAKVAQADIDKYNRNLREAELHGDKHVQYWNEAQQAGSGASSQATSSFEELKTKVNQFVHHEQ